MADPQTWMQENMYPLLQFPWRIKHRRRYNIQRKNYLDSEKFTKWYLELTTLWSHWNARNDEKSERYPILARTVKWHQIDCWKLLHMPSFLEKTSQRTSDVYSTIVSTMGINRCWSLHSQWIRLSYYCRLLFQFSRSHQIRKNIRRSNNQTVQEDFLHPRHTRLFNHRLRSPILIRTV